MLLKAMLIAGEELRESVYLVKGRVRVDTLLSLPPSSPPLSQLPRFLSPLPGISALDDLTSVGEAQRLTQRDAATGRHQG